MMPTGSEQVFPTLVGVFPQSSKAAAEESQSSPRSWGCFQESTLIQYFSEVFPTLVGVFLTKRILG